MLYAASACCTAKRKKGRWSSRMSLKPDLYGLVFPALQSPLALRTETPLL